MNIANYIRVNLHREISTYLWFTNIHKRPIYGRKRQPNNWRIFPDDNCNESRIMIFVLIPVKLLHIRSMLMTQTLTQQSHQTDICTSTDRQLLPNSNRQPTFSDPYFHFQDSTCCQLQFSLHGSIGTRFWWPDVLLDSWLLAGYQILCTLFCCQLRSTKETLESVSHSNDSSWISASVLHFNIINWTETLAFFNNQLKFININSLIWIFLNNSGILVFLFYYLLIHHLIF